MANVPEMFFYAPEAEDLDEIYATMAATVSCPPDANRWYAGP
jgi:hypothetical protein